MGALGSLKVKLSGYQATTYDVLIGANSVAGNPVVQIMEQPPRRFTNIL